MAQSVKLSRVRAVLEDLSYPISRATAIEELSGVTLLLADGEENLGEVLTLSKGETFESVADLEAEVYNLLPREAVGEPGQSEGEG